MAKRTIGVDLAVRGEHMAQIFEDGRPVGRPLRCRPDPAALTTPSSTPSSPAPQPGSAKATPRRRSCARTWGADRHELVPHRRGVRGPRGPARRPPSRRRRRVGGPRPKRPGRGQTGRGPRVEAPGSRRGAATSPNTPRPISPTPRSRRPMSWPPFPASAARGSTLSTSRHPRAMPCSGSPSSAGACRTPSPAPSAGCSTIVSRSVV